MKRLLITGLTVSGLFSACAMKPASCPPCSAGQSASNEQVICENNPGNSGPVVSATEETPEEKQVAQKRIYPVLKLDRKDQPQKTTAVDEVLGEKVFLVSTVDSSMIKKASAASEEKQSGARFVLQFENVADFSAAQRRKEFLQSRTGYGLHLVFEAPFYNIRGGGFSSKADADDAVLRLKDAGIQAFVRKLK